MTTWQEPWMGLKGSEFWFWLCWHFTEWPKVSHFLFLSLSFPICINRGDQTNCFPWPLPDGWEDTCHVVIHGSGPVGPTSHVRIYIPSCKFSRKKCPHHSPQTQLTCTMSFNGPAPLWCHPTAHRKSPMAPSGGCPG